MLDQTYVRQLSLATTTHINRIATLAFLAQILLSYRLWLPQFRDYPSISIFGNPSENFTEFGSSFLWYTLVLVLFFNLFTPLNRKLIATILCLIFLLITLDINRLQVWVYFYGLIFGTILQNKNKAFFRLQLIVAILYFWTGFHKLNVYFAQEVFPWFLDAFSILNVFQNISFLPYLIATAEAIAGIALLFKMTRHYALFFLIALHLFILICLSPLGLDWNLVVLPWNVAMIFILWLLFRKESPHFDYKSVFALQYPLGILVVIMPLFNFFGHWDEQLSFKMYAGTNPEAIFYFDKKDKNCIPTIVEKHTFGDPKQHIVLDDWALEEMSTPPYFNDYFVKKTAKELCICLAFPEKGGLKILRVNPWNKKDDHITEIPCKELGIRND